VSAPAGIARAPVLRALLAAHLAQALRPGRNAEGIVTRPLRQMIVPMAMLGGWVALAGRAESSAVVARSLFFSCGLLVTLAVLPDPAEAYARQRDVLGHLPVPRGLAGLARALFLLALLALLLLPFAAPTLALLAWRGDLGAARLAAMPLALLAMALAGVGLWLSAAFALARRFGIEGVRRFASILLNVVMVGVVLAGSVSLFLGAGATLGRAALPVALSPTSWYVDWLLPDAGARAPLEAMAGAALTLAGLLLIVRLRAEAVYEQARGARAERDGVAARLVAALDRRPAARRPARALALLVARVAERDPLMRLRARALLFSLLGVGAAAFLIEGEALSILVCATFGFLAVAGGALDLASASDAEAAWSVAAAPLGAVERARALRLVALARTLPLALLLVAALAFYERGLAGAAVFALAFAAAALWLVSATLALRPREPLATPASVAGGNLSLWLSTPLALAGMAALAPAWLLAELLPGPYAPLGALVYAASLAAFAEGLLVWAAARLAAQEARR